MIFMNICNLDIAFDGWAVALIVFILGTVGIGGYKYVTKSKIHLKQEAKDGAIQEQYVRKSTIKDENDITLEQKGGANSEQKQSI